MVNHYLLSDAELIKRLCEIVEESIQIVKDSNYEYDHHNFTYAKSKEYWEIKKELLERMSKGRD